MQEKIAILLSSYNGQKYIKSQVESILRQKVDCDFTLFIRDDGSSDNTISILEQMAEQDHRIVLQKCTNCGLNESFFRLMRFAATLPPEYRYFSFSDQDDIWDEDKLQIGINVLREAPLDLPALYGSADRTVDADLNPIRTHYTKKPLQFYNGIIQNYVPGHNQIMNRPLLLSVCNADASKMYLYDSFIVAMSLLIGKLYYDQTGHASYRQHEGNQLGSSSINFFKWLVLRFNKIMQGDLKQIGKQIEYFYVFSQDMMSDEQKKELSSFLNSQTSFYKRSKYLMKRRIHRQGWFDDLAFSILYLLGKYNVEKVPAE